MRLVNESTGQIVHINHPDDFDIFEGDREYAVTQTTFYSMDEWKLETD